MRYVLEDCSSGLLIHERAFTPEGAYIGRFDEAGPGVGYGSIMGPRVVCSYRDWIIGLQDA